nr:hypothetical protein [uncultured bacterium]
MKLQNSCLLVFTSSKILMKTFTCHNFESCQAILISRIV